MRSIFARYLRNIDQIYPLIPREKSSGLTGQAIKWKVFKTESVPANISYKSFKTHNLPMQNSYCDHRNFDSVNQPL